jgi:hypothetical protein
MPNCVSLPGKKKKKKNHHLLLLFSKDRYATANCQNLHHQLPETCNNRKEWKKYVTRANSPPHSMCLYKSSPRESPTRLLISYQRISWSNWPTRQFPTKGFLVEISPAWWFPTKGVFWVEISWHPPSDFLF